MKKECLTKELSLWSAVFLIFLCRSIWSVWVPPLESASTAAIRVILPLTGERLLLFQVWLQIQLPQLNWEKRAEHVSPCINTRLRGLFFRKGSTSVSRGCEGTESECASARECPMAELCARFFQHLHTFRSGGPVCCCSDDVWQKLGIIMDRPCLKFRLPFSADKGSVTDFLRKKSDFSVYHACVFGLVC